MLYIFLAFQPQNRQKHSLCLSHKYNKFIIPVYADILLALRRLTQVWETVWNNEIGTPNYIISNETENNTIILYHMPIHSHLDLIIDSAPGK